MKKILGLLLLVVMLASVNSANATIDESASVNNVYVASYDLPTAVDVISTIPAIGLIDTYAVVTNSTSADINLLVKDYDVGWAITTDLYDTEIDNNYLIRDDDVGWSLTTALYSKGDNDNYKLPLIIPLE